MSQREYFQLLKEKFSHKSDILTEIINLNAINHLPKGTEHFVSDLHGEYEAFDYILRSGSGTIKEKVAACLQSDVSEEAAEELCHLIYYPEEKINHLSLQLSSRELESFLQAQIPNLLMVIKHIGAKYTRSKIRKILPQSFSYIIEELLTESEHFQKDNYTQAIIDKVTTLGKLERLICSLCYLIQDLVMDHLHVVGDIFDRGKYPDKIMDRLQKLRSVDIQWGNHDVTWMGAVSGSLICMVNVIRIAARYNSLDLIEDRYGINLRPLIDYSRYYYPPLPSFEPILDGDTISQSESDTLNSLQQATLILQTKLEHQLIQRRPEFLMEERCLLKKMDDKREHVLLAGQWYPLTDFNASCIERESPDKLSQEEDKLLQGLMKSFQHSDKLQQHVAFLFEKGSMYRIYNQQLLFHGCIPLHANGDFKSFKIGGQTYVGRELLDFFESAIRRSYANPSCQEDLDTDMFWYLWSGSLSSLFGKSSMTTFERAYIQDQFTHKEEKNAYYRLRDREDVCQQILVSFGLGEQSHIINGHTPILEKLGENPIKANGKLLVIDGGFSKGYQKKTGIAGYTLVFTSYGLELVAHRPFTSVENILQGQGEVIFVKRLVEKESQRILVYDTNIGQKLSKEMEDLEYLYRYFEQI